MSQCDKYQIGAWIVIPGEDRIVGPEGGSVHVSPKAMDVLVCLAAEPGRTLSKQDILDAVWDTRIVSEGVLANAIRELRQAFRDDSRQPSYIETIPKRGYRLVASVAEVVEPQGGVAPRRRIRPVWLGGAVLLAAAGLLALWSGLTRAPEPPRLVVLGFDDLSPGVPDGAFAHGMTDLLLTELAGLNGLHVISGAEPGRAVDPASGDRAEKIARRLEAELLLGGTVLLSENRVRVNTRLVDGGSGVHLWAGTYESELGDVLDLQREVAGAVAREIRVRLRPRERRRLARDVDVNPDAFLAYTQGVHLYDEWDGPSLLRSVEYFERAIGKDPEFAQARARLARSLAALAVVETISPAQALDRALSAAQAAVRLDGGLAEGHAALALVKLVLEWDLAGAEESVGRALALNPGSAVAHETESLVHMAAGRHEDDIAAMRRAHELAPLSYYGNIRLGWSYYMAGRYREAIRALERTLELYPEKRVVQVFLAQNHAMLGQAEETLGACERSGYPCMWQRAHLGVIEEPRRWRRELSTERPVEARGVPDRVERASALAALGDTDGAFRQLEWAIEEGSADAVFFASFPQLERLRGDPRWPGLMARVAQGSPLRMAGH